MPASLAFRREGVESGGLGMLVILQLWACDHGIQFKVCDPPAGVRQSLERARSAAAVEIVGLGEALSRLAWGPEELRDSSRKAA